MAFWAPPIFHGRPGMQPARKDHMNTELLAKIKVFARDVLLNSKAQMDYINSMDTDVLGALTAFSKQFIEKDENTTKMDAFRLGIILGGVYEHNKQKVQIEKVVKGD